MWTTVIYKLQRYIYTQYKNYSKLEKIVEYLIIEVVKNIQRMSIQDRTIREKKNSRREFRALARF